MEKDNLSGLMIWILVLLNTSFAQLIETIGTSQVFDKNGVYHLDWLQKEKGHFGQNKTSNVKVE